MTGTAEHKVTAKDAQSQVTTYKESGHTSYAVIVMKRGRSWCLTESQEEEGGHLHVTVGDLTQLEYNHKELITEKR